MHGTPSGYDSIPVSMTRVEKSDVRVQSVEDVHDEPNYNY